LKSVMIKERRSSWIFVWHAAKVRLELATINTAQA
jgi:hypothetical protein